MPELIVSRLFCTDLENEECLVITGCERFSKYDGYVSDVLKMQSPYLPNKLLSSPPIKIFRHIYIRW